MNRKWADEINDLLWCRKSQINYMSVGRFEGLGGAVLAGTGGAIIHPGALQQLLQNQTVNVNGTVQDAFTAFQNLRAADKQTVFNLLRSQARRRPNPASQRAILLPTDCSFGDRGNVHRRCKHCCKPHSASRVRSSNNGPQCCRGAAVCNSDCTASGRFVHNASSSRSRSASDTAVAPNFDYVLITSATTAPLDGTVRTPWDNCAKQQL